MLQEYKYDTVDVDGRRRYGVVWPLLMRLQRSSCLDRDCGVCVVADSTSMAFSINYGDSRLQSFCDRLRKRMGHVLENPRTKSLGFRMGNAKTSLSLCSVSQSVSSVIGGVDWRSEVDCRHQQRQQRQGLQR